MTDLGYDLACFDDLDPMMREAEGLEVYIQDQYHALTCGRGRLLDAPDFGIDLADSLHEGLDDAGLRRIEARARQVIAEDPRTATVTTRASTRNTRDGLIYDLAISGTTAEGPFDFILSDLAKARELVRGGTI